MKRSLVLALLALLIGGLLSGSTLAHHRPGHKPRPTPTATPTPSPTPSPTATATPTPSPTPTAPPSGCTRTATADASGATDATAGLQADLNATPAGGTLCLTANGQYRVNGNLTVLNRAGLTIDGNGARLFQTVQRGSVMLAFNAGSDIAVHDLTIEGTNTAGAHVYAVEGGHAINFLGVLGGEATNLTLLSMWGDGIYISGSAAAGGPFRYSDGITVQDSIIRSIGRQGIALTDGARNVLIQRNLIEKIAWYAVDLEPNGVVRDGVLLGNDHVQIIDNTLGEVGLREPSAVYPVIGMGGNAAPISDVEIRRNSFVGEPMQMYSSGRSRYPDVTITDNVSDTRVARTPMQFNNMDGLTVTGNIQPLDPVTRALVVCLNCTNVAISGNVTQ